jgi:hypothetical protein
VKLSVGDSEQNPEEVNSRDKRAPARYRNLLILNLSFGIEFGYPAILKNLRRSHLPISLLDLPLHFIPRKGKGA